MIKIEKIIHDIKDITDRYGLKLLEIDHTDITLIARIGFSSEIFMQIYANERKEKLNIALVVAGERIYGIDKEGGFYHEHPFKNPLLHIKAKPIGIENFVIESLEILKKLNLF
ncbi:MAG: hypothetical protein LLF28_07965 [Nitrospiraceae bacterium]|nr:hypothetical protein [Nitrospiraceae bacterium]